MVRCNRLLDILFLLCVQWLKNDFLAYLDNWEKSVMAIKGLQKKEKNKLMLSAETKLGLKMTGWLDTLSDGVCVVY